MSADGYDDLAAGMVARAPSLRGDVRVIGAGVAGLVSAVVLAERGATVTLVERGDAVGAGASWKAGGMLAPWCEAESAPLLLQAGAEAAIGWWLAHVPGTVRRGTLVLAPARDMGALARFARRTQAHVTLDEDGIAALEPDLAGRFRQGLFYEGEAHLDPREALPALAARLQALGGTLRLNETGRLGETLEDAPDAAGDSCVVDCRGFGARAALPGLRGVRGEMLLLRCPAVTITRPVRLLHPRFCVYVVPRSDHLFMVGATSIESEQRGPVTLRSAVELLNAAYTLHPGFGEATIEEMGAELRPSLPDNMPAVIREGRVIRVNGMYRHGFLLSPALASRVALLAADIMG